MRLGLLADIHANTRHLAWALRELERAGAERFVVLGDIANVFGDVAETKESLRETVEMLEAAGAVGVWGNHDAGYCCSPDSEFLAGCDTAVVRYMSSLHPRLEIDDCLFTHVEPWLDPHDPAQLWHYDGWPDNVHRASRSFNAPETARSKHGVLVRHRILLTPVSSRAQLNISRSGLL